MAELRATYRLQLTPSFGFAAAQSLIPYLRDLGISHLYLSPSFQARAGSTHGYDVVDPGRFSDALGGDQGFRALAADAAGAGMGIVLDVVPNHMGADDANRFWADPALRERFFDVDPVSGRHRRFFDIDDLAAIRIEDPEVFEAVSGFALSLVREGLVDGLRVDHPDGLADPGGYLARLRERGAQRVWVEKILDPDEHLRDWPVSGTVGYEFLNDVQALFVDPAGEEPLSALWERVSRDPRPFGEVALEAKLEQATTTFSPEVERLARAAGEAANSADSLRSPRSESAMLARAVASLPVYRTYVDPQRQLVGDADRTAIETAVASGEMAPQIAEALLLRAPAPAEFVTRFQQTTPAIMAKGVEDTAFYRYCRLLALNDVGGDPSRFGIGPDRFHAGCLERAERFPEALITTMTHDAKRSADVRARVGALASLPDELAEAFERFCALTEPLRSGGAPDDVERYLIFQTLAGAFPLAADRLAGYVEKALREAKRNTNWVEQNTEWERAVRHFCLRIYEDARFRIEFGSLLDHVAVLGERAALCQLALKLTAPGVPDIYQGDEIAYRALVDPDNRRPVDWSYRQTLLRRMMGGGPPGWETRKLYVTWRLLGLRARRPEPFAGTYEPLDCGEAGCAFVRDGEVLTVAALPRAGAAEPVLTGAPAGRWHEVLTGDERSFAAREPLSAITGGHGFAVYARVG
jgi:(1->4)-alpha-D-glucan 1-alpha-D-glucosylmutase